MPKEFAQFEQQNILPTNPLQPRIFFHSFSKWISLCLCLFWVGKNLGPSWAIDCSMFFFLMYLAFLLDRYKLQGQNFVAWSGTSMRMRIKTLQGKPSKMKVSRSEIPEPEGIYCHPGGDVFQHPWGPVGLVCAAKVLWHNKKFQQSTKPPF